MSAHSVPSPAGESGAPEEAIRLLIIDDMAPIHEDFRKILGQGPNRKLAAAAAALFGESGSAEPQAGFELDSAYQGNEGLALVRSAVAAGRPYAMAFVDVRMPPGWDGLETSARLWEADPDLQIVICTAYSDYSWGELTGRLGQTDSLLILKKPFDNIEVLQLAHALAKKWTLTRTLRYRLADLDAQVNRRTQELRAANERLVQENAERERAVRRLAAFSALGQRLSAAKTSREAALIVVDVADQLLGWDACLCGLYTAESDQLSLVLAIDLLQGKRTECTPTPASTPPSPIVRKVIQEGGQLFFRGAAGAEEASRPFGDMERRSASRAFVPIRNGSKVIGVLSIQSYQAQAYTAASLETLQALADHGGGALDRIKTEEALQAAQEQLRQSQKLEAIGQLAGGVAHDFNNLLAVIRGHTDLALLDAAGLSSRAKTCLNQVSAAADRAANLTRQLLAFSRKQVMQPRPLELSAQVANLARMLKRIIGEHIDLQCHYGERLPWVQADAGMLDQVLINLVVNSRDAMPQGGQLHIRTEKVELNAAEARQQPGARPGLFVALSVQDTGCGIAPEDLPRIFEPFFTTKDSDKGTGLGLATVYGIVQQHQGWIEVTSQMGAGTTFRVLLPAATVGAEAGLPEPATAARVGGTEAILLVEDEPAVRSMTRQVLEQYGYRVLEAGAGPEALALWQKHETEVDLVITDMIMPQGLTGRELVAQMRARKPGLKAILMSGYNQASLGPGPGFVPEPKTQFLQKPCPTTEFLRAVRTCLEAL